MLVKNMFCIMFRNLWDEIYGNDIEIFGISLPYVKYGMTSIPFMRVRLEEERVVVLKVLLGFFLNIF